MLVRVLMAACFTVLDKTGILFRTRPGMWGAGMVLLAVLSMVLAATSMAADIVHGTFADFAGGTPGASGANLYVSHAGRVEVINRYDFDGDGNLDIFVVEDHNVMENVEAFVYLGGPKGPESILPPAVDHQPLYNVLVEYEKRLDGVVRLPSDGGGRSLLVDLNHDGYKELVFCNYIHNYSVHTNVLIYWNGPRGYQPRRRTELPSLMGSAVAAADFNNDGFVDLAVTNSGIESSLRWGNHLNLETYVYLNGPRGFDPERKQVLPSVSAVDCVAGDLDNDGHVDLAIANNDNEEEKSVYVYWGAADGLDRRRRTVWKGGEPTGLKLADLDADGHTDLLVLDRKDARACNVLDRKLAHSWTYTFETQGADECLVQDLNKDGYPEVVFADKNSNESSSVYFGTPDGFSKKNRLKLPTRHASDVAAADFNNDGWLDLVFSNAGSGSERDIDSYIYWNGPEGFHPEYRKGLRGFGPPSVAADDVNRDGCADVVLINRYSGGTTGTDNAVIYWGNDRHYYSSETRVTRLQAGHTAALAAADLDADGFTDLGTGGGHIYYGDKDGYSNKRMTKLEVPNNRGGQFADLNKDGYLDYAMVWGTFLAGNPDPTGGVFWGGKDGFSDDRGVKFALDLAYPCISPIADLNKDGYLDLIFTDMDKPFIEIYWGSREGRYGPDNRRRLKISQSLGAEIADLNADGWLDLIAGGGWNSANMGIPTQELVIAWGGPEGYSDERYSRVEGFDPIEHCVADINGDGFLDILTSNYHGYETRTIPAFIYWGSADGTYTERRRTLLPAESSSYAMVADFNKDSRKDVMVTNHILDGRHVVGSNLFWGGPDGFSYQRRHWFQTFGVHTGVPRDIGHIYTRELEEDFVSAPFQWTAAQRPVALRWTGRTPNHSALAFQFRSAPRRDQLDQQPWRGAAGPESRYENSGAALDVPRDHKWGQYRALFTSRFGAGWPVLEEVTVAINDGANAIEGR